MSKQSTITLDIELDANQVPESITWSAPDGGVDNEAAQAAMLSLWDAANKDTLRIDLWTKDMRMDDMKLFFHQTILAMADGFERATDEKEMSQDMRQFAQYFAEKLNLISSSKPDQSQD